MDHVITYANRTFFSLAIRNFRLYMLGHITSQIGIWMQSVAQAWLLLQLTDSGMALGILVACQCLPTLLLGAWAGVVIDRLPKRYLLMVTQTLAFLVSLFFWVVVATGHATIIWMYALTLVNGIITAIDMPARQTFVFELVGETHIQNAVTLTSLVTHAARIVGPAIAGALLLIPGVGVSGCILINALTFLALLIGLMRLNTHEMFIFQKAARAKGQVREGLRYAATNPTVKTVLAAMFLIGVLTCEFAVTLPLLAKYAFHGTATSYATFVTAMGIGSVLGGLIQAGRSEARLSTLGTLSILLGISLTLASTMHSFLLTTIFLAISGGFLITVTTAANAMILLHSRPDMRGRMNALWAMIFMGSTPIGGPLMGWISQHSSSRVALATGGLAAAVAGIGVYGFLARLPRRHKSQVFAPERVTAD